MWVLFLVLSSPLCRGFDRLFEGDIAVPRSHNGQPASDAFILSPKELWSGGIVPYSFETLSLTNGGVEPIFTAEDIQLIKEAMNHISKMVPCLKFREVSSDFSGAHLIFSTMGDAYNDPSTCWSYVGCLGAKGNKTGQTVNFGSSGCLNLGIVLHEIMHSLGATHEQNREDRDEYVQIIQENIMQDSKNNFKKKIEKEFSSRRTPYDYASIMHYSRDAFSKSGADTIVPLQPNISLIHSSRKSSLSPIDVMELARVYEPISKENCYTTDSLKSYIHNIEDLLAYEHQNGLRNKGYILSSTGKAAEYRGDRLGVYDVIPHNHGSWVFQQRGGTYYSYKKDDKWWCGKTVGASSGRGFYTTDLFSNTGDWYYGHVGGAWRNDQTIQFLPLTPTSCILKPSILITSTGPARSIRPDYIGSFTLVPGIFSAGRPVWRNTKGKVLMIRPGSGQPLGLPALLIPRLGIVTGLAIMPGCMMMEGSGWRMTPSWCSDITVSLWQVIALVDILVCFNNLCFLFN